MADSPGSVPNLRHRQFKNDGRTNERERGKRTQMVVALRKERRRELLEKKREVTKDGQNEAQKKAAEVLAHPDLQDIKELASGIMDETLELRQRLTFLTRVRILLSKPKNPPIQVVISLDSFLDYIVSILTWESAPDLQYEAAWVLTNVASGSAEQTAAVVEAGAAPLLVNLLHSEDPRLREQGVWALGNLAGDGPVLRTQLLEAGVLEPILVVLQMDESAKVLRNASWTVSNFFRWRNPPAAIEAMREALPVLHSKAMSQDMEVLSNCLWAVCFIAEACEGAVDYILEHFASQLVNLIDLHASSEHTAILPAIRTLSCIVSGTADQTDAVIEMGALNGFHRLLNHSKPVIRKDAAFALSNVCAGTLDQISMVIESNVVANLRRAAMSDSSHDVQREATWALCSICTQGNDDHRLYVISQEGLVPMLALLTPELAPAAAVKILVTLGVLLGMHGNVPIVTNPVALMLHEMNAEERLDRMLNSQNPDVSLAAEELLSTYFSEEQMQDPGLVPAVMQQDGQGRFQFGLSQDLPQAPCFDFAG